MGWTDWLLCNEQDAFVNLDGERHGELRPSKMTWRAPTYNEPVRVHVYDLGQLYLTWGLNAVAKNYGAFHTGVEVYGREWHFGETMSDLATGIAWHAPKANQDHAYRETLAMGCTRLSPDQVVQVIEEMQEQWTGRSYDMLKRNCHSFSDAFCQRLGVGGLPPWVNTLADTGASTVEFVDNTDSGYDGGEGVFELFSSVKRSLYTTLWDDHEAEPQDRPPHPLLR
mmetsp:Transcript_46676/g.105775  ORF Transcript_46676/g.105775 Transcript_46676/m.105775 type:complete len:225 (-) Transcript_46676:56-730(-)